MNNLRYLSKFSKNLLNKTQINNTVRFYSNSSSLKIALVGCSNATGESLALMLKQSPLIDELSIWDYKPLEGFAKELSIIDTKCKVSSFMGKDFMSAALKDASIVVITASCPNTDEMQYVPKFERNAPLVKEIAINVARCSPKALIAIGTSPINSLVPMVTKIFYKMGHPNANIFGISTIDVVRANKFVAEVQGLSPEEVSVPVIGGHTENTIVPVLSNARPCAEFTNEEIEDITKSVKVAGSNILKFKLSEGATLAKAFAFARFVLALVNAIKGTPNIIECSYVKCLVHPYVGYMSTPLLLGPNGIMRNYGVPNLTDYEECLLENAVNYLSEDIKLGESFIKDRSDSFTDSTCKPPPAKKCTPEHCIPAHILNK